MLVMAIGLFNYPIMSQQYQLESPNENLKIELIHDEDIRFSVRLKGAEVIQRLTISMQMSDGRVLSSSSIQDASMLTMKNSMDVPIPTKQSQLNSTYQELTLTFEDDHQLIVRAYDIGFAYRFIDGSSNSRQVVNEQMDLVFADGTTSFFPQEESMYSHNERSYLNKPISDIENGSFCSLPVLFETREEVSVLFSESALTNYPGMFLEKSGGNGFRTKFPKYVLKAVPNEQYSPDRNQILAEEANYIASIESDRAFPWRVFIITDDQKDLLQQDLFYELADEQKIEETDWIKPGKVAWDWYNANNIFGVDFESGINLDTYKYYIDFASENGIEYVILDEGWTKSTTEILDYNPDVNLPELMNYAKKKDVGIILWVLWKPLNDNMTEILDLYQSWGAKGIKVDFMQRNDQYMVSSYETVAKECADREMIVDFHGAFKPSGLRRMYPNIVNYEGVKGTENNKWSADITPTHNVTLPFIRMAVGPMDYTPGSMKNATLRDYKISFSRPMSLGTRAHQVAMYVIYDAPLQMMCENPSIYQKEQETVDFITQIPTTWDETIALEGEVGKYLALARRNGDRWYIGAMTNEQPRSLEISLSFLPGDFEMKVYRDGVNAHRYAEDYKVLSETVNSTSTFNIELAPGGGWSAILTPMN